MDGLNEFDEPIPVKTEEFWAQMCRYGFVRTSLHSGVIGMQSYVTLIAPEEVPGFLEEKILTTVALTQTTLTTQNQLAIANIDQSTKIQLGNLDANNRQLLQTGTGTASPAGAARLLNLDRKRIDRALLGRIAIGISVLFLLIAAVLSFSGCSSPLYPSTSGFHAPSALTERGMRYVVWSNHPPVAQYLSGIFLGAGFSVVERTRLDAIFAEQKLTLSHTRDEDVLRVGRLVGATQVIFAEVRGLEKRGPWERPPTQSVTVRAVVIESGEVRWTGLASYDEPSINPEQSVIALAHWALWRATCNGTWEEPTLSRKGGCQTTTPVTKKGERSIWEELWEYERRK